MSSTAVPTIFSGWLTKQGAVRHSWRKRFFILQGGQLLGRIDYFKRAFKKEKEKAFFDFSRFPRHRSGNRKGWKGAVPLHRAESAETVDAPSKGAKKLHCFVVRTPTREWVLGADTEDERARWIKTVNTVIAHLRDPTGHPLSEITSDSAGTAQSAGPGAGNGSGTAGGAAVEPTPPPPPEYAMTDPDGDRARAEELAAVFPTWSEREKALHRDSRELIPHGRLVSTAAVAAGVTPEPPPPAATETPGENAGDGRRQGAEELTRLYAEWGEAISAYAIALASRQVDVPGPHGRPVAAFDDNGRVRDTRFVLIAFSEAFDRLVSGSERRSTSREAVERCKKLLGAWSTLLTSLASAAAAEALAIAMHPRLGADSPARLLSPGLAMRIAMWAIPSLTASADQKPAPQQEGTLERALLAQQSAEKMFLLRHTGRLLDGGPIRFGFLTVRVPQSDGDDFAKIAGRTPASSPYEGEVPEGRLFIELMGNSICITTSPRGDEVVVPLLWIRKLEIETALGCYMKFTRYLTQPSADAKLESRILYADNAQETLAWLSDITRAFMFRRKRESTASS